MNLDYTHLAMSIPRASFTEAYVSDVLRFYQTAFGWMEIPELRVDGERLTIHTSSRQYINIRASMEPMVTSGYEHLGFAVGSDEEFRTLHGNLTQMATDDERVELSPIGFTDLGNVYSFRVAFLLPVALEIQYFSS